GQLLRGVGTDPALICRSADRRDGAADPRAQPVRRDHLRMEAVIPETNQERAIGRLEGKMDSLIEAVKAQGEKSDASRAKMYERIEGVERSTEKMDGRLQTVEGTVTKMSPLVDEFGRIKQRGVGILMMLGVLWMLLGGLLLQGLAAIVAWIGKGFGGQ